jgi:hypothetical protein
LTFASKKYLALFLLIDRTGQIPHTTGPAIPRSNQTRGGATEFGADCPRDYLGEWIVVGHAAEAIPLATTTISDGPVSIPLGISTVVH